MFNGWLAWKCKLSLPGKHAQRLVIQLAAGETTSPRVSTPLRPGRAYSGLNRSGLGGHSSR